MTRGGGRSVVDGHDPQEGALGPTWSIGDGSLIAPIEDHGVRRIRFAVPSPIRATRTPSVSPSRTGAPAQRQPAERVAVRIRRSRLR